ncbi:dephospho-CoA kinase [Maribacter sp. HTCC2170]|uniref:dephospho-CoA kinase n=1 Tax=Maribacter sp. (strain HTCC2170 / KCCM 42371) TaxID=313603 RepID=UPI00006B21BF|nr:dephospho-CoA kinase [Maribacter sp. HTCC2170]EAR00409.1 putative dephospho-CoA kinase [Maribacter sp. HTCC2170]
MMVIGLTGGIGSGKTTVAKIFKKLGVPVYNSDKKAKKLMKSSKKLRISIKNLLGEEAYHDKKLNKVYIAQKIFQDKALLNQLNSIVHPAVRKDFVKWSKKKDVPYVIQEAAIIFENGLHDFYDKTILVTAPKEIRLKRVMDRDKVSEADVFRRMKNQWEDEKKIKLADYVIDNLNMQDTITKVDAVHKLLLAHSER